MIPGLLTLLHQVLLVRQESAISLGKGETHRGRSGGLIDLPPLNTTPAYEGPSWGDFKVKEEKDDSSCRDSPQAVLTPPHPSSIETSCLKREALNSRGCMPGSFSSSLLFSTWAPGKEEDSTSLRKGETHRGRSVRPSRDSLP